MWELTTYLRSMNVIIVTVMATKDTVTPTYPMVCSDITALVERLRGTGLSNMAKCVRWLHSHTVRELFESVSILAQPSLDHCPLVRDELSELNKILQLMLNYNTS